MVRSRRSIIHCFGIWSGRTLLLAILIAGNFSAAAVADEGPAAPTVQLGIEGVVKRGCWAQARIDSDQSIATLNGYDGAGFPLQTTTLGRSDVTYLKVGRRLGRLTASMNDGDLPAVALDLPDSLKIVSSLQQCMLVVGGDVGLKDAVRFRRRSSRGSNHYAPGQAPRQLAGPPTRVRRRGRSFAMYFECNVDGSVVGKPIRRIRSLGARRRASGDLRGSFR